MSAILPLKNAPFPRTQGNNGGLDVKGMDVKGMSSGMGRIQKAALTEGGKLRAPQETSAVMIGCEGSSRKSKSSPVPSPESPRSSSFSWSQYIPSLSSLWTLLKKIGQAVNDFFVQLRQICWGYTRQERESFQSLGQITPAETETPRSGPDSQVMN